MQFFGSCYGAFGPTCPQVYAFDQNTSLATDTALNAVPKCLFTFGVKGQANLVRGVKDSKRYLANLKWAYTALPASDGALHTAGLELCNGCSNNNDDYSWNLYTTMFMNTDTELAQYFYGLCSASTGASSSGLDISAVLRVNNNANIRYTGTLYGKYRTVGYVPITQAITFDYAWVASTGVNGHSYSTSSQTTDTLALYATSTDADDVLVLDKYECLKDTSLFRFGPDDIDFGFGINPVPGTRPKVQNFLTHTINL